jgi:hypothetical protein
VLSSHILRSVSPELVVFLLGYSFLGTLAALRIFGKKMVHLQYEVGAAFLCKAAGQCLRSWCSAGCSIIRGTGLRRCAQGFCRGAIGCFQALWTRSLVESGGICFALIVTYCARWSPKEGGDVKRRVFSVFTSPIPLHEKVALVLLDRATQRNVCNLHGIWWPGLDAESAAGCSLTAVVM